VVLGFELRASCLLGGCFTIWATLLAVFLIFFEEPPYYFTQWLYQFISHRQWDLNFLHIPTTVFNLLTLILVFWIAVRWYIIMVLICISLITCFFHIFFGKISGQVFLNWVFQLFYCVAGVLCIFWILTPCEKRF
jgi:hypothetical protein